MSTGRRDLFLIATMLSIATVASAGNRVHGARSSKNGNVKCKQIELKSIVAVEDCMRTKHKAYVLRCELETASLTRQVNAIVESELRDAADYGEALEAGEEGTTGCDGEAEERTFGLEANCEPPFRVADVVSYPCHTVWDGPRPAGQPWSINLQLGPKVHEVELSDLLVGAAAEHQLWELVCADVRRQLIEQNGVPETEEEQFDREERLAEANTRYGGVNLTPDGLRISYDHNVFGWSISDSTIPYGELRGILLPRLIP